MKKINRVIALLLSCLLFFTACTSKTQTGTSLTVNEPTTESNLPASDTNATAGADGELEIIDDEFSMEQADEDTEVLPEFDGLNDENLLRYVEDSVYADLDNSLEEDYIVEDVQAVYVSKEYLEELAYNSQKNIYFGYTLEEIELQFEGTKYVFTLGEDGTTVVQAFEGYDDTFSQVVENVAIGGGVILVCVTVAAVTDGVGLPAVSFIFVTAAESATEIAVSSAVLSAVTEAAVTGYQTHDLETTLKAAALSGSESFKWGAISGAVSGGLTSSVALATATTGGLTLDEAAIVVNETKWPTRVVKKIKSMDEYKIYRDANLTYKLVNDRPALVYNADSSFLNFQSETAGKMMTNLERMQRGYAPIDPTTGKALELHHVGQSVDSPLAVLTPEVHRGKINNSILHDTNIADGQGVHSLMSDAEWSAQKKEFWKAFAKIYE